MAQLPPSPQKKTLTPPPARPKPLTPEMEAMLTEADKARLDMQVEAEIKAKQIFEAEQSYIADRRKKVAQERLPEEQLHSIFIDLPDEAPFIVLDGVRTFYPETEYKVTEGVRATLMEIMSRAWFNEECRLDEKRGNLFRRTRNVQLGGKRNVRQYAGT